MEYFNIIIHEMSHIIGFFKHMLIMDNEVRIVCDIFDNEYVSTEIIAINMVHMDNIVYYMLNMYHDICI
jgi:hypothetical protein